MTSPSCEHTGDVDVAQLFRTLRNHLGGELRRLGVARAALDDAVQDVFVVAHRRADSYAHRGSQRAWLCGIARRVASEHRRRQASRDRGRIDVELDETAKDDADGSPEHALARAELRRALDAASAELGERRLAVLVLADLEDRSGPEIAAALGLNLNTVYTRLRDARLHVRRRLGGAGAD
jgi:RNA polymerase sigma-70 factor (ECF subfamily)